MSNKYTANWSIPRLRQFIKDVADTAGALIGWANPSTDVLSTTGSIGIGTVSPDRKLEITDGTTELLARLAYDDADGSAANYVDLGVDSGGGLIVSPSEAASSGISSNYPIQLYNGGASSNTQHLGIDANEIQSKANDSTAGALYLQYYGGDLDLGGGAVIVTGGDVGIGTASPQAYLDIKNTTDDGTTNRTMLRLHNYRSDDADVNDFAPTSIDFDIENVSGGAKTGTARIAAVSAPIGTNHTVPAGEQSSALIFSTMNDETLAEAARINNLGQVGIGTTSPTAQLEVVQVLSDGRALHVTRNVIEAGAYSLAMFHDDSTSNTQTTLQVRQDGTGDILNLLDGSVEKVTVTGAGKVGIGVAAPEGLVNIKSIDIDPLTDVGDPAEYHLHIQGNSTTGKAAGIALGNSAGNVGAAIIFKDVGGYAQGELQFYTKTSTGTGVDPVQRMTIDHAGNVGIGDASPSYTLDVAGDIRVTDDLFVDDFARIDALRVGTTATDPGDGNLFVEGTITAYGREIHGRDSSYLWLQADTDMYFKIAAGGAGTNKFYWVDAEDSPMAMLNESGDLQIDGDLTVSGNDIKDSGDTTAITFDGSGQVTFPTARSYTAFSFETHWSDYGGDWAQGRYSKDSMGYIHLQGLVKPTDDAAAASITILPSGFRPGDANDHIFMCQGYDAAAGSYVPVRVNVYDGGSVTIQTATLPGDVGDWVSLDGITFYAGF